MKKALLITVMMKVHLRTMVTKMKYLWPQLYIKVEKYEKEGLSDAEAEEKADKKIREDDMRDFMNRYAKLIQYILQLRNGHLHGEIMDTIDTYMNSDIDREKAIRMALRKYKHQFEEYMDNEDEEEESMEDGTDDDEEYTEEEDTE